MPTKELKRLHAELVRVEESLDALMKQLPAGYRYDPFWIDAEELKYRIRRVDFGSLLQEPDCRSA